MAQFKTQKFTFFAPRTVIFPKNFDDTYFIGDSPPPLSATQKAYADNYTKAEC